MHLGPVVADAGLDHQGHIETHRRIGGIFHHHCHHLDRFGDLPFGRFEHQLVMDLEQHPGGKPRILQGARHADHGALDDIGGAALDGRVDRGALGEAAARRVLVVDPGHVDLAPEQGLDEAGLAAGRLGPLHVVADAGVALEVSLDVRLGLTLGDTQVVGEEVTLPADYLAAWGIDKDAKRRSLATLEEAGLIRVVARGPGRSIRVALVEPEA